MEIAPRELPMREWLELGQALTDLSYRTPKYFRAYHTQMIRIGGNCLITADGQTYHNGDYVLAAGARQ